MKLVTIILLLCVHTADLTTTECEGKKDEVVFCTTGNILKIEPPATGYTWKFGTPDGALPSELTPDGSTNNLKGSLQAKHTGVYLAIKTGESAVKFTVIVDAVESCIAGSDCNVKAGGSIKLDSTKATVPVKWEFKAVGGTEFVDVTDTDKPKFHPDSNSIKKELGLFNVQKPESGIYRTTKTTGDDEVDSFPVHVRTPVSGVTVKKGEGCDAKLECQFTGDAQSVTWTKDKSAVDDKNTATGNTLTIANAGTADNGDYACKAAGYHDGAKTSADFPYTYAVSTVTIKRSGNVLTCDADGAVKGFAWLTFGNVPVSPSDGKVGPEPSQFTLDAKAKGQFICKVTACNDKINSQSFDVSGAKGPIGSPGTDQDNAPKPTAATQGASCSVALLVISVLIELYVVVMM